MVILGTPLCLARHLPLKGEIGRTATLSIFPIFSHMSESVFYREGVNGFGYSISPLEGKMPGRAEGGEPRANTFRIQDGYASLPGLLPEDGWR